MKMMKIMKVNNLIIFLLFALFGTSCEDYLDKAPEMDIKEEDVFKKFASFQGYIEDVYQCVPDVTLGLFAEMNWNFADDVLCTDANMLSRHFDAGNYWYWEDKRYSPFWGNASINSNDSQGIKGYWHHGWLGIRKANNALSHLNDLVTPTQEQRDLLEGQALFFRGYLHFEILRAWGGVAYVEKAFLPSDDMKLPRLSYIETANKITADLQKAAGLLPANWDETTVGQTTLGQNAGRVTKMAAYGYLGKNLLYAASPLMNGVTTGSYTYNEELCKEAANALYEVIKLADQGYCGLETWADYYKNFYTLTAEPPIGKEIIFNNPVYRKNKRWRYGDFSMTYLEGWGCYSSPTENYVENFGMANGLPIDEADSGYDHANPWVNRDPRFYYNILKDGDRMILAATETNPDAFAKLYTNGRHRNSQNSITGYGYKKYKDLLCNPVDNGWNNYTFECPNMRLADVYLMYAEAVNEAYGPTGKIPGGITALEAINIVRSRATVPGVDARFLTKDKFREIIRKERAVELAFEGHRWYDNRRQYISHLSEYREKYILEFPQNHSFFTKTLHTTIVFDKKHYWLPFSKNQVNNYMEFKQNPGW